MLGERGEGAQREEERVLAQDREPRYGRAGDEARGQGFDCGPGQVDIEEEEQRAKADNGGLCTR